MTRPAFILCAAALAAIAQEDHVTFRSDVSLVRVDVQVLDRGGRAVTGLRQQDFVLREQGKIREIRNFASEDMPLDVLLLMDVSGSMRINVERLASAAQQAFQALGPDDRVGLMVFDRRARTRMPFRPRTSAEVMNSLDRLLNDESFRGGTDVVAGIYSAVDYVRKNARRDARKAIVIMTDDQTEFQSDVSGLVRALHRDDIVLSLLLAPDGAQAMRRQGGGYPQGGYPGGRRRTGGIPGVIWGGGGMGWPGGGGGGNGPVIMGRGTHTAGTDQVAEQSGGDTMNVDQASALEDTLVRLRQRYALHFNLPDGVREGQERDLQITLASAVRNRYPDADLRYRHTYVARESNSSSPAEVTRDSQPAPASPEARPAGNVPVDEDNGPAPIRRRRVSDPGSGATAGPMIDRDPNAAASAPSSPQPPAGGWPKQGDGAAPVPAPAASNPQPPPADNTKPKSGGWPRIKEKQ